VTHDERARKVLTRLFGSVAASGASGHTNVEDVASEFAEVEERATRNIVANRVLLKAQDEHVARISQLEAQVKRLADESGFDALKVEKQQARIAQLEAKVQMTEETLHTADREIAKQHARIAQLEAECLEWKLKEQCTNELFEASQRDTAFYQKRVALLEAALEKADTYIDSLEMGEERRGDSWAAAEKCNAYQAARAKVSK
jgi:chromosome segregation ATPase